MSTSSRVVHTREAIERQKSYMLSKGFDRAGFTEEEFDRVADGYLDMQDAIDQDIFSYLETVRHE
jgi:hypothetical protein